MKKTVKIIGNSIVYLLIALILISALVSKTSDSKKSPELFGYSVYSVLTGSMEPTMKTGSIVVVKNIPVNDIEKDDVITFRSNNTSNITTHRVSNIINEDGLKFITKGDANNAEDPLPVNSNLVIGKVIFNIPFLGKALIFIRKNLLLIIAVLVIAMAVGSKVNNSRNS